VNTALQFHELRVGSVDRLTDDAVSITFEVPQELQDEFSFTPGQHVTVRAMIDGDDVRRSYSICIPPTPGSLRIGVKQLRGGAFSTYANTALAVGDTLDVMTPVGEFVVRPDGAAGHRYVAIVAGSGITPVMSMVATTLAAESATSWTVMYGNRDARSVMFLDELEGLKDRYPTRLQLIHVLSREDSGLDLTSGRIDERRLRLLFSGLVTPEHVDRFFLCGPYEMVMTARRELAAVGVPDAAVSDELFFAGPQDPAQLPPPPDEAEGVVDLAFTLDGRTSTTTMLPETTVLDAALAVRTDLPFSCRGGMCATCKAHIVEGHARMGTNYALVAEDLEAGYVLTCQAHPVTDRLVVDYDHR
jgi:ring-1,2-phenylacetyl-CoA epoxidase subunit PaaE